MSMSYISSSSEQLHILDCAADLQQHAIDMVDNGLKHVGIFSQQLNPVIFDNNQFVDALSKLARHSRASEIRIIVSDARSLIDNNHKVLALSHRLTSKISIRKLMIDPPDDKEFMLVDYDKLWLQHKPEEMLGFANYAAAAEVKSLQDKFEDLWKNSVDDSTLRQLLI